MSERTHHHTGGWTETELAAMDTTTSADELDIKRRPVERYLARLRQYGKSDDYVADMERILVEYREWLDTVRGDHVCNIDDTDVAAFNEHLKGGHYVTLTTAAGDSRKVDLTDGTRYDYVRRLVTFYDWLIDGGIVSVNPARKAISDLPDREFDTAPPGRRRIELSEMRAFVQWLPRPVHRALILTLLKTGARVGEAVNLDLCCLNLTHPTYERLLADRGVDLLPAVADRPDTLYFEPGFQPGTEVRGEVREHGSKRQAESGTLVPLDAELKTALVEYILVRRLAAANPVQARPLFVKEQSGEGSARLTHSTVYSLLTTQAGQTGVLHDYGWYEEGAPTEENVTPHYFRHYFTHNHREGAGVYAGSLPESTIAYVRGDAPDTSTSRGHHYRHGSWDSWSRDVKRPYLRHVYQFGAYSRTIDRVEGAD